MDGVLVIDKPAGPTSHDVVARIRRITGVKRVGHAGTLDPDATGVLIVCVGKATRVIEYMADWHKEYRAKAVFGVTTDSQDASGSVISSSSCPHISMENVREVLPSFTGPILQVPPMVSAVHHNGQRLYKLARAGVVVERESRPVEIYRLDASDYAAGENPSVVLDVECSKGTYIRTLCADIGYHLGCGAHMVSLVRTAVGRYRLDQTMTLDEIESAFREGRGESMLRDLREALSDMPVIEVGREDLDRVSNGMSIEVEGDLRERLVRVESRGMLVAIGEIDSPAAGRLNVRPVKVLATSGAVNGSY